MLGTFVSIRISGMPEASAHRAIDRGFAAVARIHALMSFHEPASDVSRLNRLAWREAVPVDPATRAVLICASELAHASASAFDISIGGEMVTRGLLPAPAGAPDPEPGASWRDVQIGADGRIRFARPLWIDLGGIAKGYAVDAAIEAIAAGADVQVLVNAGGDLRLHGPVAEPVYLAMKMDDAVPMILLENGSLASSTGVADWGATPGSHIDARDRRKPVRPDFVAVAAPRCMTADALTKVVLALGGGAKSLLRHYDATAYLYDGAAGWSTLGAE